MFVPCSSLLSLVCLIYSTGHCLRHCAIPRLLLLLHYPTGPALPVLFRWPTSSGKNRLGKGRQRRMYPTSVRNVHSSLIPRTENAWAALLWFSTFCVWRHFSPFGGNGVIHLPASLPSSLPHSHFTTLASCDASVNGCMCVFDIVVLHTINTTHSHTPVLDNITTAACSPWPHNSKSHYLIHISPSHQTWAWLNAFRLKIAHVWRWTTGEGERAASNRFEGTCDVIFPRR